MMQNAICDLKFFFIDDSHHNCGKCSSYFVRFYIAKTCCKAPLWICINQQNFLSLSGKSNSKIYGCGGFSNSTFLV